MFVQHRIFFSMCKLSTSLLVLAALGGLVSPSVARAQAQNPAQAPAASGPNICGAPVPPPVNLPPENSGPVVYFMGICFDKQGGTSTGSVENETYLYYIHLRPSLSSQNQWVPWDETAEKTVS